MKIERDGRIHEICVAVPPVDVEVFPGIHWGMPTGYVSMFTRLLNETQGLRGTSK